MSFYSTVAFRIEQTPPNIDKIEKDTRPAIEQLYLAMQQVIATLVSSCGISSQPPLQWAQIAAQTQSATVLAANVGRVYALLGEAITEGAMCQLYDSGAGVLKARNANATNNTKFAHAYCSSGGVLGDAGEFILTRGVAPINGLTVGARYFLSTTDGLVSAVAPVAAGNIEQYVGFALSTTQLYVDIQGAFIQH